MALVMGFAWVPVRRGWTTALTSLSNLIAASLHPAADGWEEMVVRLGKSVKAFVIFLPQLLLPTHEQREAATMLDEDSEALGLLVPPHQQEWDDDQWEEIHGGMRPEATALD